MRLIELFEQTSSGTSLDKDELEDLLSAVEYEQEEVNNISMDAEGDAYNKLERDYRALTAVETVIRNNLLALAKSDLLDNSIFLYDYQESGARFSVAAVQVWIEDGVAHVKWLGSYGKRGKPLLTQALAMARARGATSSKVEAKWDSEGFYHKLGYDVTHRGAYNPFSDSALIHMRKDLEESRSQEQVHHNPNVATLKALARNSRYHSARFVITKDGDVIAADSEHHTHHSMAPYMGAWEVRGYVQDLGDGEYAYRSMDVYSALNKDHPLFRTWERLGIQNGNPEQSDLEEAWSKKYKQSIDCNHPRGFSQRAHCAGRRKRAAGGRTQSKSVS